MFENKYLSRIYILIKKVVASLFTRNAATFLFFLVLAFLFWLMHGTGAIREVKMKVPIHYVGIPSNVELLDSLPNSVNIVVKDKGAVLWPYYFKSLSSLQIDLSGLFNESGSLDLPLINVLPQLMSQFPTSTTVYDNDVSQIVGSYRFLSQKEVPVCLAKAYAPELPYVLKDSVTIEPSHVNAYGPESELKKLNCVYVDPLPANINKNSVFSRSIKTPEQVKVVPKVVRLNVAVEMSTEKSVTIPIEYEGCPSGIRLRTFPEEVKVSFNVGVSQFKNITSEDFKVVLNYDSLLTSDSKNGRLLLKNVPNGVYMVRMNPSVVEYILEEEN